MDPDLVVEPVAPDRWPDVERLFGERGASSGCWCMWWRTLAPRDRYPRLQRSPNLGPVDDRPVWVISCFYIDRHHRGTRVAAALLAGAIRFARANGAQAVEGVPIDTSARTPANADLYTGTLAMFLDAGFEEIARRGRRPIVRRVLR